MSGPRTALIVDDEDQLLRLMERVVRRAGYRTLTAADAASARHIFEAAPSEVDLVLLDVLLPDGGAADLLPGMLAEKPDLEVILTSGDLLPEALGERLETVGGRFLRKPFVPKTLLRLVEEVRGEDPPAAQPPRAGAGPV